MRKLIALLTLWLLFVCLPIRRGAAQPAAGVAKPVLMMGTGYSRHERAALRRDILEPNEITFEDGGEWTSAELWGNYSVVIVTHGFPALNERELGWIRDYLNTGGTLLLSGPVLGSLRDLPAPQRDWLGVGAAGTLREGDFAVAESAKALVPDAGAAQAIFGRGTNSAGLKPTTAEPLVTRSGQAVLFRNAYGKGEVWFVGLEYFRILTTEKLAAEKVKVGTPARELLQKIIMKGGAQKKSERAAIGLKAYGGTAPVVWRRDFANARGAAFAEPPYPRRGEELKKIHLDLGMDEWESVPFYVSSAVANKSFSITIPDLLPTGEAQPANPALQARIAASAIRLRVQGVAAPDLTVGPFWLLDVPRRDTAAGGAAQVPLDANLPTTAWLTLRTHGVAPGLYRGQVRFSDAAMPPLELEVRVWPVRLPGREYFAAEATSMWSSLLSAPGTKADAFGPKLNVPLYLKHLDDIAAHHITASEDNSWSSRLGKSFSLKNVKIAGTDLGLEDAIAAGKIDLNNLPALDFSYFDALVEPALERGMPYFKFAFKNLPTDWILYARQIAKDNNLAADSPQHEKVKRWLLGECVRYLHEKGIRKISSPIADEIAPEEMASVQGRAKLMQDNGLTVALTTTGRIGQSRDLISQLNPAIDRWIWNSTILPSAKSFVRAEPKLIDAADDQYTYLADWHRAAYVSNRAAGPFCAYWDLDGLFFHGYLRWYPNGGAVFATTQGPIDTEGWEGARDGIEDARYFKKLQLLLRAGEKNPALKQDVDITKARLARWVGKDAKAYVHLEDRAYSIYKFLAPVATYESLNTMKAELLDSLQTLERDVPLKSTLRYGNNTLMRGGAAVMPVSGPVAATAALNVELAERGIGGLPSSADADKTDAPTVLIGNGGNNARIKALIEAGTVKISVPPPAGSYTIREAAGSIVVYALDEAGAIKGARILGNLIEQSESP